MALKTAERVVGNIAVVDIQGRALIDAQHPVLETVSRLLKKGTTKILLNYAGVNYIDEEGIGEIVSCLTKVNSEGGTLKLLNPSPQLTVLLLRVQLAPHLRWFHDEEKAPQASLKKFPEMSMMRTITLSFTPFLRQV